MMIFNKLHWMLVLAAMIANWQKLINLLINMNCRWSKMFLNSRKQKQPECELTCDSLADSWVAKRRNK